VNLYSCTFYRVPKTTAVAAWPGGRRDSIQGQAVQISAEIKCVEALHRTCTDRCTIVIGSGTGRIGVRF
jgi:hypothetical protein